MPTRFTVVCDDDLARDIRGLARQYELTDEEVIHQLLEIGINSLEESDSHAGREYETTT